LTGSPTDFGGTSGFIRSPSLTHDAVVNHTKPFITKRYAGRPGEIGREKASLVSTWGMLSRNLWDRVYASGNRWTPEQPLTLSARFRWLAAILEVRTDPLFQKLIAKSR